ncbi:hypothetical protein Pmar_PMAR013337, partial [Perkinsus marinus ATCC 50983]
MTNIFGSLTADNAFGGDNSSGGNNNSLNFKLNERGASYEGNIITRILGCLAALAVLVVSILGHFSFAEE